ncbi:unnamed protein product [Arctia plantaginis]|uniref:Endonuclease-reverse transcriptase n=1 Tax=Arctia plantaginis TaxID=874455 RepID=A0A8S1B488_ARCPL|nr:unnamed protein product [Arctia plantaginis]
MEMKNQTIELTESLTKNIMDRMDEKLMPIKEENEKLKERIGKLEKEIEHFKREKKSNNLIIFGLVEGENSTAELFQIIKENFKRDLNIKLEENEVNKLNRLGKPKAENKPRPVLCSLLSEWKKNEIMKNKKKLNGIYISEDYSKEVLEKRKALVPQLLEERKRGSIAFLKYDKIIIKEPNTNKDKRKREQSTSPQSPSKTQPKKQQTLSSLKNTNNRTNAFDVMRIKSNSLTNISTRKNQ